MDAPAHAAALFAYPTRPHARRHGPSGYVSVESYKDWLRDEFQFRCVYCLFREQWYPDGKAAFGVDHVRPRSQSQHRSLLTDYENLVYACNQCNALKGTSLLLDPCQEAFANHVRLVSGGQLEGLTREGRLLITRLDLNGPERIAHRVRYLGLYRLLRTLAEDAEERAVLLDLFGYPDDLPDLARLRPPANSRPGGVADCYYRRKSEGRLAAVY